MSEETTLDADLIPSELETPRLRIRKLTSDVVDPDVIYEYLGNSESIQQETKYLLWDPLESVAEAEGFLENCDDAWDAGHRATYYMQRKDGPSSLRENFLGMCSLTLDREPNTAQPGVYLRKQYWGEGYAMERVTALLELAFETLSFGYVEAVCLDGNDRARSHVEQYVEKYGGDYAGVKEDYIADGTGENRDCHSYQISAEQYRKSR